MDQEVERALLSLCEYKNNFYSEKAEFDTKKEKEELKEKTKFANTTQGWNA